MGLLILVWGGVQCFKALERTRVQPQSANEALPAESKVQEVDDTSSRGAEFSAIDLIPVPEEEYSLNEQPAVEENADLASNIGIQDRSEFTTEAPLPAAEDSDTGEGVFSVFTSEENDAAEDIQESTSSIEEVSSTLMDIEDAKDTDSAANSQGLDIENESLEDQNTDILPDESFQRTTTLVVEDPSTSQDRDVLSETNSRLEEDVSDAVLEELAKGMSLEALRQRALLAASAASAASQSARQAAACSASASAAAAMAVSAAERAIAASGNAQAAMEHKSKSEVLKVGKIQLM